MASVLINAHGAVAPRSAHASLRTGWGRNGRSASAFSEQAGRRLRPQTRPRQAPDHPSKPPGPRRWPGRRRLCRRSSKPNAEPKAPSPNRGLINPAKRTANSAGTINNAPGYRHVWDVHRKPYGPHPWGPFLCARKHKLGSQNATATQRSSLTRSMCSSTCCSAS